jgi:hypothetical protein
MTLFENTNKGVHLIHVSVPKWDNLQTAYTNLMRKYPELSIAMKLQWQVAHS